MKQPKKMIHVMILCYGLVLSFTGFCACVPPECTECPFGDSSTCEMLGEAGGGA